MASAADGRVVIDVGLNTEPTEQDVRRQVAKLAAEYKKAGMSASDAFKKAWSEVERGTPVAKKTGKAVKREIGGSADYATGKLGGLSTVLGKITSVLASVFAVGAIINFGKECVELGSNVAEVQNVVDTAFGDMSYKVEAFAETAIENFGMSRLAAKKTASTYMAMAKGMGIAEDAASDMAISLAGMTGDVASFYNITQEAADTKLKSVFTGETESLKELGVVMTQANLKAYALEKGINKDLAAMSQSELVALRYSYVMDSLALAQGDFAKTSDSWANQTRILSMQWEEFMSIVGQALITVLTPLVKILNQIVYTLISAATAVNGFVTSIFGTQATQVSNASAVASEIGSSVEQQEALTAATEETAEAQKSLLAGFDEITKLDNGSTDTSSSSGGDSGLSFDATGLTEAAEGAEAVEDTGLVSYMDKLKEAVEPFRKSFTQAFSDIRAGFGRLKAVFSDAWGDMGSLGAPLQAWAEGPLVTLINQIVETTGSTFGGLLDTIGLVFGDIWNIVMFPSIQQWIANILPALTEFVTQVTSTFGLLFTEAKGIFDRIWSEAIAPALTIIQGIWSDAWNSVVAVWDEYGAPIFDKIREAIQNVSDYLHNIWETIILPIWETIMSVVDQLWTEHLKPLWDKILGFIAKLVDGALEIYNKFIAPIANWFVDAFGGPISGAINGVIGMIGDIFGVIADVAGSIFDILGGVIDFIVGVFTGD